eukprot:TRINITY_DN39495_c0_g1_i3.p1 TRINITY_DN39495_c0_g1~~TRINITY_DN39495_c0_g1_i3.p1  ORF type:complete len:237 (-),score=31.36 TRINITY_DN39495_c0_g1_i3:671-1381(-)
MRFITNQIVTNLLTMSRKLCKSVKGEFSVLLLLCTNLIGSVNCTSRIGKVVSQQFNRDLKNYQDYEDYLEMDDSYNQTEDREIQKKEDYTTWEKQSGSQLSSELKMTQFVNDTHQSYYQDYLEMDDSYSQLNNNNDDDDDDNNNDSDDESPVQNNQKYFQKQVGIVGYIQFEIPAINYAALLDQCDNLKLRCSFIKMEQRFKWDKDSKKCSQEFTCKGTGFESLEECEEEAPEKCT